jgi:GT2 family glycosyltransferase
VRKTKRNQYFRTVNHNTQRAIENCAIVLLNWNGRKFLEEFLPSLCAYSANARIVMIDNASTDDSITFVNQHFSTIEIVENDQNYGFAGGYNEGLKHIKADYYLLINTDVEVTENWLEPLFERIIGSNCVAVQPKILAHARKTFFEHAGASGGFMDGNGYIFCRGRIFELVEEDRGQYDYAEEVFWTSGACMLIKSSVFWEVGAFDSDFFAHMEEIDLCWRLKKMGYALWVEPKSVVYHVGGGTLNYDSPRKTYLNYRNSLAMLTKNLKGFIWHKMIYRMMLDGVSAYRFLFQGKFSFFSAIFKAHIHFYLRLPSLLRKRHAFKQLSKNAKFNSNGWYTGNVIWAKYIKKIKRFEDINQRLFK